MFEDFTQERLLSLALDKAGELNVSKTPGSLLYNSTVIMATMLEDSFDKSEEIYINAFPDTCDREHLIRFARAKGLSVKAATPAEYEITSDSPLPDGTLLTAGELNFRVTARGETKSDGKILHTVVCEEAGEKGNGLNGELFAVDEVEGFSFAFFERQTKEGTEDEETEEFRERFFRTYSLPGQFGNRKFYRESALAFENVGAVSVSTGTENGSVILKIVDKDGKSADESLCALLQKEIHKPLCHELTVGGAPEQVFGFSVSVSVTGGMTQEDAEAAVKKIIGDYIKETNLGFKEDKTLKLRLPMIQMRIFEDENITDCEISPIDGKYTIELESGKIAKAGEIIVSVT